LRFELREEALFEYATGFEVGDQDTENEQPSAKGPGKDARDCPSRRAARETALISVFLRSLPVGEQLLADLRVVPERAIAYALSLPPRCGVLGGNLGSDVENLEGTEGRFLPSCSKSGLWAQRKELHETLRFSIHEWHAAPAPKTLVYAGEFVIVTRPVGYEDKGLGYGRAIIAGWPRKKTE